MSSHHALCSGIFFLDQICHNTWTDEITKTRFITIRHQRGHLKSVIPQLEIRGTLLHVLGSDYNNKGKSKGAYCRLSEYQVSYLLYLGVTYRMHDLIRWTQVDGCEVRWGNMVGPYSGQSDTYKFATRDEAVAFANYASSSPSPSLAEGDLLKAGIPLPLHLRLSKQYPRGTRCDHWKGPDHRTAIRCNNEAEFLLFDHEGIHVPGGPICAECGRAITTEYRDKLNWNWTLQPITFIGEEPHHTMSKLDHRHHFRSVTHSSLRPFVNSSPADFPASDRRIGVIARSGHHPTHDKTMIEIEVETPSFVSSCRGEYVDVDNADGVIRAKLLENAAHCRKVAEELLEHADRLEDIAVADEVMSEVTVEVDREKVVVGDGPTFAKAKTALKRVERQEKTKTSSSVVDVSDL